MLLLPAPGAGATRAAAGTAGGARVPEAERIREGEGGTETAGAEAGERRQGHRLRQGEVMT